MASLEGLQIILNQVSDADKRFQQALRDAQNAQQMAFEREAQVNRMDKKLGRDASGQITIRNKTPGEIEADALTQRLKQEANLTSQLVLEQSPDFKRLTEIQRERTGLDIQAKEAASIVGQAEGQLTPQVEEATKKKAEITREEGVKDLEARANAIENLDAQTQFRTFMALPASRQNDNAMDTILETGLPIDKEVFKSLTTQGLERQEVNREKAKIIDFINKVSPGSASDDTPEVALKAMIDSIITPEKAGPKTADTAIKDFNKTLVDTTKLASEIIELERFLDAVEGGSGTFTDSDVAVPGILVDELKDIIEPGRSIDAGSTDEINQIEGILESKIEQLTTKSATLRDRALRDQSFTNAFNNLIDRNLLLGQGRIE